MMARALGRAEHKHNPSGNEIKELAKKIGDESLTKTDIGIEYYKRAGFIDLSTLENGKVYEWAVDEPLMFYTTPSENEGNDQNDIKTVVVRIRKMTGVEDEYEVETIKKQGGSSSLGKSALMESIFLQSSSGRKDSFTLAMEKLEDERFKFTVRKN